MAPFFCPRYRKVILNQGLIFTADYSSFLVAPGYVSASLHHPEYLVGYEATVYALCTVTLHRHVTRKAPKFVCS